MNSGSQTKSQVKNTECRSKPSQLLLIHRKTGYVAPNLACSTWAVSCVLQWDIYYSCDEHRRSFSIPRINSFKGILNSPIILFIHLTTHRPFLPLQAPHSPAVVPLRAPAKGSPNTEGCCSSSLMGQHGQTMLWTCLWEPQARPMPSSCQGGPCLGPPPPHCSLHCRPCPHTSVDPWALKPPQHHCSYPSSTLTCHVQHLPRLHFGFPCLPLN